MAAAPENSPVRYEINDLVVDTGSRQVTRDGHSLKVVGLTFDLLVALAEAAPAMLSYDALAERVWDGRPVSHETMAQRVKMLRDALDDDARDPRYVEPIRGQGYRLLADVEILDGTSKPRSRKPWYVAASIVLVAAALVLGKDVFVADGDVGLSVAVLPFADMSESQDQQFLADGFAEELINRLTRFEGLDVASRTSSFAYRAAGTDTRAIADELGVATVLEGSVRKSEGRIRVTAQLIDAASGYHLWSDSYDRELTDIFEIQAEVAEAVAGAFGVRMGVGDVNAFSGAGTANIEAYEAYLRAAHVPPFPLANSDERVRLLERAVELDPDYAAAWAALGLIIASRMWFFPVDDAPGILDRSIPVLERAIELGPDSAFAYTMLATASYPTFDWLSSEQYYLKAIEILPGGVAFGHYANMLMRAGRSSEALRYTQRAAIAERNAGGSGGMVAWIYMATGDLDKVRAMRDTSSGASPDALPFSFIVAINGGDIEAMRQELISLPPATAVASVLRERLLDVLDTPGQALELLRSVHDDREVMWPSKYHDIALLAAFFGDPDFALEAMAYEARKTTIRYGALWFPVMSEVRKLPAFKQLVTDVNLVEYWRTHGWTDHCRPLGDEDFECF
ncbi:MAG: winged helix-turn-helix domain-containing protein [Woeseiaceae bacterium]|jgi:TolB-like protein/DNA-binding winged helix-turn-helix (wHTH) protein|nr:winged helix-turn-helix domain-containing protein [Woeseiaceae bacterium]